MAVPKQLDGPLGGLYLQKGESTTLIEETTRVVNLTGATKTVDASESGCLFLFNKADGIAVTLPAIAPGLKFRFLFQTAASGGSTTITAATGDLLIGGLFMVDTDSSNAVTHVAPDVSDDLIMTFNGGTQGGLVGTYVEIEAIGKFGIDGRWLVTGLSRHTSNVATPFS